MARKPKAPIVDDRIHRLQMQVPGGPRVWLAPSGSGTMDPDSAHQFPTREAAEKHAAAISGPRSSHKVFVISTPRPAGIVKAAGVAGAIALGAALFSARKNQGRS